VESPGLAPTRIVLPNGAVVLARRTQTTPAVTINIAIRAGSVCDPADAPGSMYLLSKVIDRGTLGALPRSADDIAEALGKRIEAGQDQVNAGMIVFGEQDPAIDEQQLAVELDDGHVAADIAQTPQ